MGSRDDRVKLKNRISHIYIVDSGMVRFGFSQSVYPVPEEDASGEGYILEVCVELFSGELDREVVIGVEGQDGSAVGGEDYVQLMEVLSGLELVFEPLPPAPQLPIGRRKREVSLSELCVNVSILVDDVVETDEYFSLVLSSVDPGVTLMPANATVVISNNDYANVSLALEAFTVAESDGNVSVCAVLLGGELSREVAVNITTSDTVGTAAAGSDYTSVTDYTLSFAAGSPVNSLSCVDIVILEDSAVEDIERFYVELSTSDPVNILSPDNASVSILDDDVIGVGLISSSFTVNETDGYLTVGVEILDGSLELERSVLISTQAGTATPGLDYEEILSMMLSLPSGLGVGDVVYFNVSILNDEAVEELFENFTVHLNDTARVSTIGTRYAVDMREDEADVVMVTFGQAEVLLNEGDNGSVCVNVTGQLERQVVISVSISGGSASTGSDHDFPASISFNFSSSPDTYCISFNAIQDAIYESDETFSVRLDSSDPQVNSGAVSTVSIVDVDEVELQLVVANVCESDGPATVCVQLKTDTEREVMATVQTSDLSAQSGLDYIASTLTFSFPNPSPADTMQCGSVPIMGDTIVEPCEAFYLNLTSSAERSRIVDDDMRNTVIIYDDEDVNEFLLFNDSPKIYGTSLTVDYTISGCAQVLCQVISRMTEIDCSPPTGSFTGQWYLESLTKRKTSNNLAITIVPYCPNQNVPVIESRKFRIDNTQCSVVFTGQQYEVDPVSGDVTVEWAGTGPTADIRVSEFTCRLPDGTSTACTSPFVLTGLASGNHIFVVTPLQISDPSLPQCGSGKRGLIRQLIVIRL